MLGILLRYGTLFIAFQKNSWRSLSLASGSGRTRFGSFIGFSCWQIVSSRPLRESTNGIFAVSTFTSKGGRGGYDRPVSSPVAYSRRLPLTVSISNAPVPPTLVLRVKHRPPAETNLTVDRVVNVPFTSVLDDHCSLKWKMATLYSIWWNVRLTIA